MIKVLLRKVDLRSRHCGSDRGSITVFATIIGVGLLLAVGLIADGGVKIRATQQADSYAEEAAREAGQAIQASSAIQGERPVIDVAAATRAAQRYLASNGVTGQVSVTGPNTLTVTTTITRSTVFLGVIGMNSVTARGDATVRLVRGVDGEEPA